MCSTCMRRRLIRKDSKQRPAPASLTNGNVGDLPPPGNDTPKTGLPGQNGKIRTFESRDAWQTVGDWRLIFIAKRSGFPRRRERHCRRTEIRADWPYSDPALLAMVPLRGFGGDGAWCRRNRKGSSNVAQQNPHKDRGCARQEPRETACKASDGIVTLAKNRRLLSRFGSAMSALKH
jgi:hypothetical protein